MTQHTKGVGTPLWMAPEVLSGGKYGPSADVYSFAIVLWEIASQAEPWENVQGSLIIDRLQALVCAGERPPVDERWPVHFRDVMVRCWQTDPSARPPFSTALAQLGESEL